MSGEALAEQLARHLRRDILRGQLAPGAAVKERDTAAELGVSRTPMREAIRILAQEGLVVLRPGRSPVIAAPTYRQIADQVAVLLALEHLSADLACAEATEVDLERLRSIHARIVGAQEQMDTLDLFEIDMGFHMAVAEASHNDALVETHRAFLARLWHARYLSARQHKNRERVIAQHGAILRALEDRDRAAVRVALDTHLGRLAEDIGDVMAARQPAPEPARRRKGQIAGSTA